MNLPTRLDKQKRKEEDLYLVIQLLNPLASKEEAVPGDLLNDLSC